MLEPELTMRDCLTFAVIAAAGLFAVVTFIVLLGSWAVWLASKLAF